MKSGILSTIKQQFVSQKDVPRTIVTGPFRGLRMNLNLTAQSQVYLGIFEREVYGALRRFSARLNTAIDVGAANGEYTLYFLARTTAQKVRAFEPSEAERAKLLANLTLNGLAGDSRLQVSAKFVSDTDNDSNCSLDSLSIGLTPPCLIKIDIDGGEVRALEGARQLMRLPQIRWLIETHSPSLETECIKVLQQGGYRTRIIPNAWWRVILPEQRPIEQNRWLVASQPSDTRP